MNLLKTSRNLHASSLLETVIAMSIIVTCLSIVTFIFSRVIKYPNSLTRIKIRNLITLSHLENEFDIFFEEVHSSTKYDKEDHSFYNSYISPKPFERDTISLIKPKN